MPRANKIRVTNIRLDSDSKIIGDKTWDLFGNSSIFLLENGGGKTSIIQLLHQVVLPNHTIQKRVMANGVKKDSTRHIAVEWISDDNKFPNFVTGFCFHNYGVKQGKHLNRTYDYFNYIFEYDIEDELQLKDLPFTQEGEVTTLEQFQYKLKQVPGIHLFNSNKEYQEALEQYGLLESEWKNIAKVNGEEGGVTEFFDRTNKTVTLIERLLIPSLTESLYDTKEESNAIVESFKKYKKGLLELPELEKDLQDFEVIIDHSDPIIDSFKKLETRQEDLNLTKKNLTKLYVTVSENTSHNVKTQNKIKENLTEIEAEQNLLDWKIDSYKIYLLKQNLKISIEKCNTKSEEVERLNSKVQSIKRKIKEQKATKAYEQYRVHKRQVNDIKHKLDVAKIDVKKRNSEFLKVKKQISEYYQYLLSELLKKQEENNKELNKIIQLKTLNQNELNLEEENKSDLEKEIAKLNAGIEQYGEDKVSLQKNVGDLWKEDVATTSLLVQGELERKKNEQSNIENELTEWTSKLRKTQESIIRLENELPVKNNELKHEQETFDLFTNEEMIIKETLRSVINFSLNEDLFVNKDTIYFHLAQREREYKREYTQISIDLEGLSQLKNGIEQRGYHIHPEIEEVIEYLKKKSIDVVSGVRRITNSSANKEKKLDLIKRNPMLLFSILAEASQMNEIKNTLKLFKKELTIPIIFIDRLQLNNQAIKDNFYPIEGNLFAFNQFGLNVTSEDWDAYVQSLEKKIEDRKIKEQEITQKIDQLNQIKYKTENMYKKYNAFSRENFSKRITSLEEEIDTILNKKKKLENDFITINETKCGTEQALSQVLKRIEIIYGKNLLVKDFIERYSNIESMMKENKHFQNNLKSIMEKINKLKEHDDKFTKRQKDMEQVLNSLEGKVTDMKRDFTEYKYDSTTVTLPTDKANYEETRSYYNQLRDKNSVNQAHVQHFQDSLNTHKEYMDEAIKEVEKNDFTLKAIESSHLVYHARLLEDLESDSEATNEDLTAIKVQLGIAQKEKNDTNLEIEQTIKEIKNSYSDMIDDEISFEYKSETAESEYELFQSEKESLHIQQGELKNKLEKLEKMYDQLEIALEELRNYDEFLVKNQDVISFKDGEWNSSKPRKDVQRYTNTIRNQQRLIDQSEQKIELNIMNLKGDTDKTGNNHLIHSIEQFIQIFKGSNYDEAIESFYKMLEGIDSYRESLEVRRNHSDKSRSELIEQMYQRAEVIHKNVVDIAKSSQIEDGTNIINLIKITWPKNEYNHIKYQMRTFVDSILSELTNLKKKGALEKEINDRFAKLASLFNIVNCYADTSKCNIKVLKPRTELLSMNKEYVTWDNIETEWSGGERQIARISMFISFLNHLRKARFAKEMSWKFIIFDNPFDKIQSDHVVKPMIELAKRTNTQLFCFTGVNDRTIQAEFDTVISNKYIYQHGSLLLDSEVEHKQEGLALESLFYSR